ncbi:MAG: ankyrin repeat domain-containing protein [Planctomycetota bacterium]|nr:ankyrin repeat domain-containing protein [Planctomycetota bacterium]
MTNTAKQAPKRASNDSTSLKMTLTVDGHSFPICQEVTAMISATIYRLILCPLAVSGTFAAVVRAQDTSDRVDFVRDVMPILQQHCVECHNPSLKMGHLVLTSRDAMVAADVVTAGDADASLLSQRLHDRDLGVLMPPTGRLSKAEMDQLNAWIETGAAWPRDVVIKTESNYQSNRPPAGIFKALRDANDQQLSSLLRNKSVLRETDHRDATPLIYAAYYSSPEAVQSLLQAGADPNVADQDGLTPLMFAISDLDKVRMLIRHGANVDAETKLGRRAILMAAAHAGNAKVVLELMQSGADIHYADRRDWTAISLAARTGDYTLMSEILSQLNDTFVDYSKMLGKALGESARANDLTAVRLFLSQKIRHDQAALDRALVFAATHGNQPMTEQLITAGANPNSTSPAKFATPASPFLAAAYSETQNFGLVKYLLSKTDDIQQQEKHGKTALAMAREHGSSDIAEWLLQSGAIDAERHPSGTVNRGLPAEITTDPVDESRVRAIVQKSTNLLQSCDPIFFAKSGCIACHHQTASALVVASARQRGIASNDQAWRQQIKLTSVELAKKRSVFLQRIKTGGAAHRFGYLLWGLSAADYPPDEFTDAACYELAGLQRLDGSWLSDAHRPPTEYSSITATAVALHAIDHYSPPGWRSSTQKRVARATNWLARQQPEHNAEKAFRLLGLHWGNAPKVQIATATRELLLDQSDLGGWAQRPGLAPDAYATGLTLYALQASGETATTTAAYQNGIRFLVSNSKPDGSWHVQSRSFKFQPYFESGFPHGPDQWISAAATGWSCLAMSKTLPTRAKETPKPTP